MARVDNNKKLRASILDRLIDNEPHLKLEAEQSKHQKLRELRQNVRRDVENMLNTRYRLIEPKSEFTELDNSLLNYGLPDLATVNMTDKDKKQAFINQLEKTD